MGTTIPLDTVRHLLWLEGAEDLGIQPGLAFIRLVSYIKAADEDEREWLAERHPDVVQGVLLLMRAHWALDWMRGLVKRSLDGLPLGDELDIIDVPPPFAPLRAADVPSQRVELVWAEDVDLLEVPA